MPRASTRTAVPRLSEWVAALRARCEQEVHQARPPAALLDLLKTIDELPTAHGQAASSADLLAQAAVALALAREAAERIGAAHRALLSHVIAADPFLAKLETIFAWPEWEFPAAQDTIAAVFASARDPRERLLHGYESFLAAHDGATRRRRGVYYTPRPLVDFVVRGVDEAIRRDLGLPSGLAATEDWGDLPAVRVLDPATGTGTFLVASIERIHATLVQQDRAGEWNDYVPRHLLPRLFGIEILPAAYVLAHANLALALADTGFRSDRPLRMPIELASALAPPRLDATPFTVVLGNPPYAGNSANAAPWIADLLRGRLPDGSAGASYYRLHGEPLGEKKLWLADDYVKFLRLAQWHVERAGYGVISLVTSHGYLDNATHRGLREALRETFPRIALLDLHGNAKNREQPPPGRIDRNVFSIEQGVAVGLFVRPRIGTPADTRVSRGDLWGTREEKLAALMERSLDDLTSTPLTPRGPHFTWTADPLVAPHSRGNSPRLWRLCDAMPTWTTAPVTARDAFVVAFTREELRDRLAEFRDLSIDDATIRARWFTRGRSPRYAAGDTRGWKLSDARRALAADSKWERSIVSCLYRPFDVRWIAYRPDLIDWPRAEVMRHMLAGDNLALIARRQSPPGEPCRYFWLADQVTLDGVIRSDNRGTEAVFPLYLRAEVARGKVLHIPNFAPEFVARMSAAIGLPWQAIDRERPGPSCFGPLQLFHYLYALVFTPSYRERFANQLRGDYPPIPLPHSAAIFFALGRLGRELAALHQGRGENAPSCKTPLALRTLSIDRSPTWTDGAIQLGAETLLTNVSEEAWNYRVGAHQVLRKWLRDRRGRNLLPGEWTKYCTIATAIQRTIELERELEATIAEHGGWESSFERE